MVTVPLFFASGSPSCRVARECMVNTFVVSKSLPECAALLDYRRLGKQRVEAYQIIKALEEGTSSWLNHPACRMWKDHVEPLKLYYNYMVREWETRGYTNNMPLYDLQEDEFRFVKSHFDGLKTIIDVPEDAVPEKTFPWWFGWEPFLSSHRASLVRKSPDFYGPLFLKPDIEPYLACGYIWPDTLPPNVLERFDCSMVVPIGLSSPVLNTFTMDEIVQWSTSKNVNPRTGYPIASTGKIYRTYQIAYSWAQKYRSNDLQQNNSDMQRIT